MTSPYVLGQILRTLLASALATFLERATRPRNAYTAASFLELPLLDPRN